MDDKKRKKNQREGVRKGEGWARAGREARCQVRCKEQGKSHLHLSQYNDRQPWVATGGAIIIRLQDSPPP